MQHTLDIPCAVAGISAQLYRVDDTVDPTASIAASVLLSLGADVAVVNAKELRLLVRRLSEAARILDGNRRTWEPMGTQ